MRRKVVFVGLDGAEPELLRQWSDEGALPHLQRLMSESASMQARGPAPFGDGVFWPSFFTGVGPAKHGRYFRIQLAQGTYNWARFDADKDYARPPVWQLAGEAGRRAAVIDVPHAPLVAGLDGAQLVDWIVHDRCGRTRSEPAGLAREIAGRFGTDPNDGRTGFKTARQRTSAAVATLVRQLERRIDAKLRASLYLLRKADWDLFMVAFQEAHDVGHLCWHLHDTGHAQYPEALAGRDPVKDVYVALDRALGELAGQAGDRDLILLAGLGMEPSYTGNHMLDAALDPDGQRRSGSRWAGMRCRLPAIVRGRLGAATARAEAAASAEARRQREFFVLPHNQNAGAIRINRLGRDPGGRVRPGRDYEALCAGLAAKLGAMTNADTGEPAFAEVIRVSERFAGPCLDRLPDLLAVWNRSAPILALRGPGIGETPRTGQPGLRTGDHSQRALALARGAGIAPGRGAPVSVMDLGATVAALLGVSIPNADGTPIARLVTRP